MNAAATASITVSTWKTFDTKSQKSVMQEQSRWSSSTESEKTENESEDITQQATRTSFNMLEGKYSLLNCCEICLDARVRPLILEVVRLVSNRVVDIFTSR